MDEWIKQNVLEPMKINKPKSDDDLIQRLRSGEYFGEIKMDGNLFQLVKTDTGEVHLFSRTTSKKTGFFVDKIDNVPHIKEWAEASLPNETILQGEIYYPGCTSKDVTKIMGCLPEKAIERQIGNPIHYYLFDILLYGGNNFGRNLTNLQRYNALDTHISLLSQPSWLEVAQIKTYNLEQELEQAFANGEEGMVFKLADGAYMPGKRPTWNVKAKTEDTVDAIIVDFIEPEKIYTGKELDSWPYWEDSFGKKVEIHPGSVVTDDVKIPITKPYYHGWYVGFVVAALDDKGISYPIANVSSGLTDFIRQDCAANPANYIGKVAEIQCMSVDKEAHTLRHPRLIRIREADDKAPQDCTFKNIFG